MINLLENAYGMDIIEILYVFAAIIPIGGITGFVYEEIFYRIDLGKWVKRGSTFGPWIPIYGVGAILLALTVYHFRAHWIVVFLLSCLITGALELVGGWAIYKITGKRLWNYNTEIWHWGNIGGFVCARSVILFGIGGLALVYIVFPIVIRVFDSPHGFVWENIMLALLIVFVLDIILHRALKKETHRVSDEDAVNEHAHGNWKQKERK